MGSAADRTRRRSLPLASPGSLGVRAVRPLAAGLRALGHDPAPMFAAAGLDEELLADPDARVPAVAVMTMLADAAQSIGDASLGLHLAEHADLASFDIHAYAMLASPTFGAACERLCRYQRLIHDTTRVVLEVDGPVAVLRHVLPGALAIPRHSAEFVITCWLRVGRLATGIDWAPVEVRFAHAQPLDTSEIARFYRAPARSPRRKGAGVSPRPARCAVRRRRPGLPMSSTSTRPTRRANPAAASLADRGAPLWRELRGGIAARRSDRRAFGHERRTCTAVWRPRADLLGPPRPDAARVGAPPFSEKRLAIGEVAFHCSGFSAEPLYRAFTRWTESRRARIASKRSRTR